MAEAYKWSCDIEGACANSLYLIARFNSSSLLTVFFVPKSPHPLSLMRGDATVSLIKLLLKTTVFNNVGGVIYLTRSGVTGARHRQQSPANAQRETKVEQLSTALHQNT